METWKKIDDQTRYFETKDGAVFQWDKSQPFFVPGGMRPEVIVNDKPSTMTFDEVQNMAFDPVANEWASTNMTGMGSIGMLRKKLVGVGYGKTVTVQFTRKNRHPRIANLKFLRVWNDMNGAMYPNFYIGQPGGANGDWLFLYTEPLVISPFTRINLAPKFYPLGDDQWHDERYDWKYPSAYGKADGMFAMSINGQVISSTSTWQCEGKGDNGIEHKGLPFDLCIQTYVADGAEKAGYPLPAGSYTKIKGDILVTVA